MENPSAFMAASMQGVIEKLRAQEKELARLHLLAQERAQESERLTEEVTRNMPTACCSSTRPARSAPRIPRRKKLSATSPVRYRSYKEILGADSDLARMLTACLREGKTFQRGEVEHTDSRRRGAPHRRHNLADLSRGRANSARSSRAKALSTAQEMKVSGALCLMSDLTELTALQKQIRWKENLAALGEMSAGIAHEFKNSLATISGYAQMIRSEAKPGEIRESAEKILDQTRALAHVVTEFLRFAKPLEICYETVPMQALVERVAEELHEGDPAVQSEVRRRVPGAAGRRGADSPGAAESDAKCARKRLVTTARSRV